MRTVNACLPWLCRTREETLQCAVLGPLFFWLYSYVYRLNTILDLRADNDRLQTLVTEYRARLPAAEPSDATNTSSPSQPGSMYATSSLSATRLPPPPKSNDIAGLTSDPINMTKLNAAADNLEYGKTSLYSSVPSNAEDQAEEGSKKKKVCKQNKR